MGLSSPAVALLNTWLMEAADQVVVGEGYVNVLDVKTWRDGLTPETAPMSRELALAAGPERRPRSPAPSGALSP